MSRKTFTIVSACLMLAMVGRAAAHYTFIVPEKFRVAPGEMFKVGFHASDGFPESTQLPKRLESAFLHSANGSVAIPAFTEDGLRQLATITAPAAGYVVLTAQNPARTADMSPSSFLSYLKEENLTDVIEAREKRGESAMPGRERYSMYLKSIVLVGAPDEGYKRVVGQPIEIVLEKDPALLKAGEPLPVRILLKGKPAANLQVFAATVGKSNQNIGKTDSNGRLSVPVQSGRWRLHTIHMEHITDAQADWESFWATLTFEVP